ncbi:MAG: hypothetical protein WDA18_05910 [Candidatus Ratteibacteria bacterium]
MATDMEYTDCIGCIHVHFSPDGKDGDSHFFASEAEAAGLDFLFLTPHTPRRKGAIDYFSWDGYRGNVLLFAGEEVDEKSKRNHLLIWGRKQWSGRRSLDTIEEEFSHSPVFSLIAHPRGWHRLYFRKSDHRWDRPIPSFVLGMEVWSLLFDWSRYTYPLNVPVRYAGFPDNIEGPDLPTFSLWDTILAERQITGIAGLDIHPLPFPLGLFDLKKKFSFRSVFSVLRNHVLIRGKKSMEAESDQKAIVEGISSGRVWCANDHLADSRNFSLRSSDGTRTLGDSFLPGETIRVHSPEKALICVKKNGIPLISSEGRELSFSPNTSGVYRVELFYRGKPWIIANPFYVSEKKGFHTGLD